MKVKFANGVVKDCTAPVEQKVFKAAMGGVGWMLLLRLTGAITSTELDAILTEDNVKSLKFSTVADNGEDAFLFTLDGYEKITSSIIRHSEDTTATHTEIQLTKGV